MKELRQNIPYPEYSTEQRDGLKVPDKFKIFNSDVHRVEYWDENLGKWLAFFQNFEGDSSSEFLKAYLYEVGDYKDVTDDLKYSDSNIVSMGTSSGNALYIACSNNTTKIPGIEIGVSSAAVLGTGSFVFEYWNGLSWVDFNYMLTEVEGKHVPKAKNILVDVGNFDVRFDVNLLNSLVWVKNDDVSYGSDLFWVRLRIVSDIDVSPEIEFVKLHTNGIKLNKDGFLEFLGNARPKDTLRFSIDDAKAWQSSPSNQDLYVLNSSIDSDYDLGVGRQENKFQSGARDAISFESIIPLDLDTSSPIIVDVYFQVDNSASGNINWKGSKGIVGVGEGITESINLAPTTIRDAENVSSILVIGAGSNNKLIHFRTEFYVSEAIALKNDGSGDNLFYAILRDGADTLDTYGYDVNLAQIKFSYYKWCVGGHV